MNVSVIGLGKLGTPLAVLLASNGHRVQVLDSVQSIADDLSRGKTCIDEPCLQAMLDLLGRTTLSKVDGGPVTCSYPIEPGTMEEIAKADFIFIVVPTPTDKSSGGFLTAHVEDVAKKLGKALVNVDSVPIVSLVSTVMPGQTLPGLVYPLEEASKKECGKGFHVCYNPEFVALGSAIQNMQYPDFVLVGCFDKSVGRKLGDLWRGAVRNNPPACIMSITSAEIAKLALNCFVTTKISYANFLGELCEKYDGADVDDVTAAMGWDKRIGQAYLRAGTAYGGPCFPRDNLALQKAAHNVGVSAKLPDATREVNLWQTIRTANTVCSLVKTGVERVCILGRAYKVGTKIEDDSAGMALQRELSARGIAAALAPDDDSPQRLISECQIIVIMLPDPAYCKLDFSGKTIVDCWRLLNLSYNQFGVCKL